jgi:hypothetical protein
MREVFLVEKKKKKKKVCFGPTTPVMSSQILKVELAWSQLAPNKQYNKSQKKRVAKGRPFHSTKKRGPY